MASAAPRIYDLHPLLAGSLDQWPPHLERIAKLGFDTVHVRGLMAPGASGSIQAVADPLELHPSVRGRAAAPAVDLVRTLAERAAELGLSVTTELPVARVAIDAKVIDLHPAWFAWENDRPSEAAEHSFGNRFQRFTDLTELPFDNPNHAPEQAAYFAEVARHFLSLGIAGFRCPAAHRVPTALWRELIDTVRKQYPDASFTAAALGMPFDQLRSLEGAGFDFILDSSRWWDFREPWFLAQREALRLVAAPASFPEEPDGLRLAETYALADDEAVKKLYASRYLIAAALGNALIMPMGYEIASRRRFDSVHGSPADWQSELEQAKIDLAPDIAAINATKAKSPALSYNGPLIQATGPNSHLVALLRLDKAAAGAAGSGAALVVNPDLAASFTLQAGAILTASGGKLGPFQERSGAKTATSAELDAEHPLAVPPLGARLFLATKARPPAPPPLRPPETGGRVAFERIEPELDGGRFPAKRMVGETVEVTADVICDGHDIIAAQILYKAADEDRWRSAPMTFIDNDRWGGRFVVTRNTRYLFTLEGWKDPFASWRYEITKKHDAGVPIALELVEGREIVEQALAEAGRACRAAYIPELSALLQRLKTIDVEDQGGQLALLLAPDVQNLMRRAGPRHQVSRYPKELAITVDRTAAAFAAWYELFPRSMSDDPERHGTFDDVIRKLPYVRSMGFDVLYFPPIHPIGRINRKGRNNTLTPEPGDPGSPYAIGSVEGGHDAILKELGTFDDFKRLIAAAADHGLEIAIDFAIQCSPDHPWIKEHKDWFDWRPDGSIRYAENPPKKYQDIVNVDFYKPQSIPDLWEALRDIVLFWCDVGIRIFRVDNPHTKPLPFWEWMIAEVQARHPDSIFLAEAFTKPKMMKRLAKLGFTQSYSYFTWRNTKWELTQYLTELTREDPKDYMRVNFFVNTPDINPIPLQTSGRAGFRTRALLAATLSPAWGLYSGFELCEGTPIPGREEYVDSEKYEIKAWDWDRPGHIRADIALFNRVRRENPALWSFRNLDFLPSGSEQVIVYMKTTPAFDNIVIVAINLDPHNPQGSSFELPLWRFDLPDDGAVAVEDLASGNRFDWRGKNQYVWLDHNNNPYAIWRVVLPGLPS